MTSKRTPNQQRIARAIAIRRRIASNVTLIAANDDRKQIVLVMIREFGSDGEVEAELDTYADVADIERRLMLSTTSGLALEIAEESIDGTVYACNSAIAEEQGRIVLIVASNVDELRSRYEFEKQDVRNESICG